MPENLSPKSETSAVILPATGTYTAVLTSSLPFGVYSGSADFITGAVLQVAFTYKKLECLRSL